MTTQTQKTVIIGTVGLVVLYLITRKTDNGGVTQDPTGNGTGNVGGTTTGFNAKVVAEDLYDAMKYMGTDEDIIIGILKYVSASQFDSVFTAFGRRQYNATLGNQQNPLAWVSQLPYIDLKGWLKSELSEKEYLNLKRKYPTKL